MKINDNITFVNFKLGSLVDIVGRELYSEGIKLLITLRTVKKIGELIARI